MIGIEFTRDTKTGIVEDVQNCRKFRRDFVAVALHPSSITPEQVAEIRGMGLEVVLKQYCKPGIVWMLIHEGESVI